MLDLLVHKDRRERMAPQGLRGRVRPVQRGRPVLRARPGQRARRELPDPQARLAPERRAPRVRKDQLEQQEGMAPLDRQDQLDRKARRARMERMARLV